MNRKNEKYNNFLVARWQLKIFIPVFQASNFDKSFVNTITESLAPELSVVTARVASDATRTRQDAPCDTASRRSGQWTIVRNFAN